MIDEYIFRSKYSRYNNKYKRRESWEESVDRMMNMHLKKTEGLNVQREIEDCRIAMKNKEITGSQRALQFGGEAVFDKNMRIYNCTSSYADRPRFFAEALWLLLCGSGVGFSVQKHHIAKLPTIQEPCYPIKYVVRDSIEGWADAVNSLMNAYFHGMALPYFDFSKIRPKGSAIKHGGKAPGSKPLEKALDKIEEVLKSRLFDKLRTIDVFDIVMHLADSVLTAGIRRAATIATFDIDDELMLNSKVGNWFETNPQRGRANISAVATPQTTKEQFERIFKSTQEFGEPAVIFLESTEFTVNPCVEVMMCPLYITKNGNAVDNYSLELIDPKNRKRLESEGYTFHSGWQACNLSTINAKLADTPEKFYEATRKATILGTIQSSYTNSDYLGVFTELILKREYLLGVSICGVMDNPEICLNPAILKKASQVALDTNKEIAKKLGIKTASRITCIKPEGTTSLVLGSASGIHPHHSRKYIRRVNANLDEPIFQAFAKANPHAVEDSVWGADKVISFALEAPEKAITKSDLTAVEFMEYAMLVQKSWVNPGTNYERLEGATHNVSITVTVKADEWDTVKEYLWENRKSFCGVSFLPETGDYDYPQAPFQSVDSREEELKKWKNLKSKMIELNYDKVLEYVDSTKVIETAACAGGSCSIL